MRKFVNFKSDTNRTPLCDTIQVNGIKGCGLKTRIQKDSKSDSRKGVTVQVRSAVPLS